MKLPFVSRERYNELAERFARLERRYDVLLASSHSTRRTAPVKPPVPQRDPMVEKIASDIENQIPDKAAARAEAQRIKREAFGA